MTQLLELVWLSNTLAGRLIILLIVILGVFGALSAAHTGIATPLAS